MPSLADRQIPPPSNWQDFESLCTDLWARVWADPDTQRNGRQGQRQQGVDIYGRPGQRTEWAGVQCKVKGLGASLTRDELLAEVDKAKGFRPALAAFIVATTVRRDARLQEVARLITEDHLARGLFSVQVFFWDDILTLLSNYPDLLGLHCAPIGQAAKPSQAPPLPSHYVARPAETEHLLRRLCTTGGSQVLVVGALHGQGGIGKSTLAAAVARSPRVQKQLRDGVLWATLGQQPDLLSELSQWIQGLGDHAFRPSSVAAATGYLRSMLHGKAVLLVIDDAWSSEHVRPFLAGGELARTLVTTRRADVADEIGAELLHLGVLRSDQALALLASSLGRDLAGPEAEEALAVADAVGFSPLALELAAARVRRGVSWRRLRDALEQEIARLEELESARGRRGGPARLEASLNLSLEALRAEDEEAWRSFVALGVLPEDALVAAPMAGTLWRSSDEAAEEVLELLWSDALLLPAPPVLVGGRSHRGYRLHDLLHHVARRRLTDPPPRGLGSTLEEAHASLVDAYRARCRQGLWQSLQNDGYIHARLTWHLEKAGFQEELHLLLREETARGNAWFEARHSEGQVAGYLADIDRAWSLCDAAPPSAVALGRQCFYAGIQATFVSFAASVPPALVAALVRYGIWAPSQGLAYARQAPPGMRAAALLKLVPLLPASLLSQVLSAVQGLDTGARASVLAGLARHADDALLATILAQARALGNDTEAAKALLPALLRLPDSLLSQGLAAIAEARDPSLRLFGLLKLLPRVPENLLGEVLTLLAREEDAETRALVLREIATRLRPDLRTAAAALAVEIENKAWKGVALFAVAAASLDTPSLTAIAGERPWLSLLARCALPGLASAAAELEEAHWAAGALAFPLVRWFERLAAAKLGDFHRQMGLEPPPMPGSIVDDDLARAVLPWVPADLLTPALEVLCAGLGALAADLLPALFPHLGAAGQAVVFQRAPEITDAGSRSRLLLALRSLVAAEQADRILATLLTAGPPPEVLAGLLPSLSGRFLVLASEGSLGGRPTRHPAVGKAPRINLIADLTVLATADEEPEDEGDNPLEEESDPPSPLSCLVRSAREEALRSEILDRLSDKLPPDLLASSRRLVAEQAEADRNQALAGLAGHWAEALDEIGRLGLELRRADALASVAPYLPDDRREKALDLVLGLSSDTARAQALRALVPLLSGELLQRALEVAARSGSRLFLRILAQAAPFLPSDTARETLSQVERAGDEWLLSQALELLIPRLSRADRRELPSLCHRLGPSGGPILRRALPLLPDSVQPLALRRILADLDELPAPARKRELRELLTSTPPPLLAAILLWAMGRVEGLAEGLDALAPRLPEDALALALTIALREGDGRLRADALLALIPFLSAADEPIAALEIVRISSRLEAESRAVLLVALASRLRGAMAATVLQQALSAARTCSNTDDHKSLLLITVARLGKLWHAPEAAGVKALVPHPRTLWGSVLDATAALQAPARREVLRQAAAWLPTELLPQAWELALDDWADDRLPALKALAQRLGELSDQQMLQALWFQGSRNERSEVLRVAVAALLPDRLRTLARSLDSRSSDRRRLLTLVDASARRVAAATPAHLRELLDLSEAVDDKAILVAALWRIALHAPDGSKAQIFRHAFEALALVREDSQRVGMLLRLCAQAPDPLEGEFLARAGDIEDERDRAAYLATLASRWPEAVADALNRPTGQSLMDPARSRILCELSSHLSPSGHKVVLGHVRRLAGEEDRLRVLAALGPRLAADLWPEAFALARELSAEALRARGLAALSSSAPLGFIPQILDEARGLPGPQRLLVLHGLIPRYLADLPLEELVDEALDLRESALWVKVLAPAADGVPAAQRKRAWLAFQKLPAGRERNMVLRSLQPERDADPAELDDWFRWVAASDGSLGAVADSEPLVGWDTIQELNGPAPVEQPVPEAPAVRLVHLPHGTISDLPHLIQIVDAARTAAQLLGDNEGALRLLEHAAALSPSGAAMHEIAAALSTVWAPTEQQSLPLPASEPDGPRAAVQADSARGRLLAVGQAAFDCGWYPAAIKVWSRILESDPDDPVALERVSWAEDRLTALKSAMVPKSPRAPESSTSPFESQRRHFLEKGQDAFDRGRFQEAIDAWSRLFLIDIDDVEAEEAIKAARMRLAGERVPAEHMALLDTLNKALRFLAQGDLLKARSLCESILRHDPELKAASDLLRHVEDARQIRARVLEARKAVGLGWFASARRAWEGVLQLDPSHAEALEGVARTALLAAADAKKFRRLASRALWLLDSGSPGVALDLWIKALALDLDPADCQDIRDAAVHRFDPLCRERVAELLWASQLRLSQGEVEAAVGFAADALRMGQGQGVALDLLRAARRQRDNGLTQRAEDIRHEVLKALAQGDLEGAIALLPGLSELTESVPLARRFARELGNQIRAEQWRVAARRELAQFRVERLRGDKIAALQSCARIFDADPNHQLAGWALQLSRGFPLYFDPSLLLWPPVPGPRDPETETLVVLLTMALEDQEPTTLARFVQGQAELDRGETAAAVASWRTARYRGFEPSWQLYTAEWQLQAKSKPPGAEEIHDILALVDDPPLAWSETSGAWARTPEEFVLHLARILPWLPDRWVTSLMPQVLGLSSAYLFIEALSRLAPHLAELPLETLRPWWNETLRCLCTLPRPRYLAALALLLPVQQRVAGEEASLEVAGAIHSLARGWP